MYSDLWGRFLKGDNQAFSSLYDTCFQELYVYALRLGFDEERSKDAIHDVFYNIYISREKLTYVNNIKFYLLISLKNRLFNIYRQETKRSANIHDESKMFIEESNALKQMIDDELSKQMKERVDLLLQILTPRQQQVIHYRFVLNLKFQEIALLLNIKPDSVKKMLYRALQQLREHK